MALRLAFVAGDFAGAAKIIVDAVVASGGVHLVAAESLDVADRQLRRWITRLGDNGIDVRELAAAEGVGMRERGDPMTHTPEAIAKIRAARKATVAKKSRKKRAA